MNVQPLYREHQNFESEGTAYTDLNSTIDDLLIKTPNATFIGLANGDSMQDVGIFSGDLLVVDRSLVTDQGDIVVANYNGNFVCKIIDKKNKQLLSASKAHPPVDILEADVFQLEGVVICSVRFHRKTNQIPIC